MKRQGGWQLSACKIAVLASGNALHPFTRESYRCAVMSSTPEISTELSPERIPLMDPAMRLAASIFHMIGEWKPNLVLDLHESKKPLGAGGLGYSLIFSDDKLTGDLIWELLLSNEEGGVCQNNFGTAFPGVSRSLNRVVTEQLKYPVITVETLCSDDLEERISEQLSVVGFFLDYFGIGEVKEAEKVI